MFGMRLMLLGVVVLLGAGIYWLAVAKTPAEIDTEAYIEARMYGADEFGARKEAEAKVSAKQWSALYPAALGLLLIGIGWAVTAKEAQAAPISVSSQKPSEVDPTTSEKDS